MRRRAIAGWRVDSGQAKEAARELVPTCGTRLAIERAGAKCGNKGEAAESGEWRVVPAVFLHCLGVFGTIGCLTRYDSTRVKGQGPGLVNVLWVSAQTTHALSSASRRSNRTDMHDRSVFSARISVCISSVAREAAAFAPPVALSPAVLASPIAPPSAVPVPYASCSTRADSDVAAARGEAPSTICCAPALWGGSGGGCGWSAVRAEAAWMP